MGQQAEHGLPAARVAVNKLQLQQARSVRGEVAVRPLGRVFLDGLMVNLLNPKVILFILAFLPQFVDPSRAVLPQFLVLGLVFSLGGLVVNGVVAVFAGGVGQRLAGSAVFARWLGRVGAVIFAGLAVRLALMTKG